MRRFIILILCLFLVGCRHISLTEQPDFNAELLIAHNKERANHNEKPLKINEKLTAAAQKHAEWMAHHHMSHDEGFRNTPSSRISAEGYKWRNMGENIAEGATSVEQVMEMWMDSRGHRANILGDYEEVGFGEATSEDGTIEWCVDFGTR